MMNNEEFKKEIYGLAFGEGTYENYKSNLELLQQALLLAHTAPSNRVDAAIEIADYLRSVCTPEELEQAKRYVEEAIS
jgi:hypothetical protein